MTRCSASYVTAAKSLSRVRLCATPWTAAHQASRSMGFSRQEHWSALPFPSPMRESEVAQSCLTLSNPLAYQALPSMGFSGQQYWSGVPLPSLSYCMLLLLPSCFSRVRLYATPWTAAYQASLSLGFSRQEHWNGLPFPSPMHESGKWKKSLSHVWLLATPWTACSLSGSSVHGIFWATVLEWGAIAFSLLLYTCI